MTPIRAGDEPPGEDRFFGEITLTPGARLPPPDRLADQPRPSRRAQRSECRREGVTCPGRAHL